MLAALLIELPQHLERLVGWEIGWTDTHAHSHTQIGNASDTLSSVVFFDKFD